MSLQKSSLITGGRTRAKTRVPVSGLPLYLRLLDGVAIYKPSMATPSERGTIQVAVFLGAGTIPTKPRRFQTYQPDCSLFRQRSPLFFPPAWLLLTLACSAECARCPKCNPTDSGALIPPELPQEALWMRTVVVQAEEPKRSKVKKKMFLRDKRNHHHATDGFLKYFSSDAGTDVIFK